MQDYIKLGDSTIGRILQVSRETNILNGMQKSLKTLGCLLVGNEPITIALAINCYCCSKAKTSKKEGERVPQMRHTMIQRQD